jgi:acyl transferase domain-containing protein
LLFGGEISDVIQVVPGKRWDVDRWKLTSDDPARYGAFLDDAFHFDHSLFGLSTSESFFLDPEQRMLLEISHEALSCTSLHASLSYGVFVGISTGDYSEMKVRRNDADARHAWHDRNSLSLPSAS